MRRLHPRRVCRNLRSGIIYADHLSDNDFMAADVMTIILAAAAGVTVYLVAHFVIGQIRIPIYPFIIAIVLAVITAGVVYFTLRNNRTEVADWWNRNVGSNRGLD